MRRIALLLVVLLAALALVLPGAARAVPVLVPYSGQLIENGQPVEGARNITVSIYDVATGGAPLYTETFPNVPVSGGVFQLSIGPPTSVWSGQDRWAGVSIDGGAELAPRTRIGSVPYAQTANEAVHAHTADGMVIPLSSLVTILGPGLGDQRNNASISLPNVWYTVPNRTLSFTKQYEASKLKVTYMDTLGCMSKFYDGCEWRIMLDDVEILYFSTADLDQTTETYKMTNAAHVAWTTGRAGVHTVSVQNRGARGAWEQGTHECLMGWNTRGNFVSVEEIP